MFGVSSIYLFSPSSTLCQIKGKDNSLAPALCSLDQYTISHRWHTLIVAGGVDVFNIHCIIKKIAVWSCVINKLVQSYPWSSLFPTVYVCVSFCWSSFSSCLFWCFEKPQQFRSCVISKLVQADPWSSLFPTLHVCVSLCWSSDPFRVVSPVFDRSQPVRGQSLWNYFTLERIRFGAAIYIKKKHLFGVGFALIQAGLILKFKKVLRTLLEVKLNT